MQSPLYMRIEQYCAPWGERKWLRWLTELLLIVAVIGFGWLAFSFEKWRAATSIVSLTAASVLILGLMFDSLAVFYGIFFGFSKRSSIRLVRSVSSKFDIVIKALEQRVRTVPVGQIEDVIERGTMEVVDDFVANRPHRRILGFLFARATQNLLIIVLCFSAMSGDLTILYKHWRSDRMPFKHTCYEPGDKYYSLLLHGFYYHTVFFQSLGDGEHAPLTPLAQLLATVESYLALAYIIFLMGGGVSVATFSESVLEEKVISQELKRTLQPIWTRRVPITSASDPRIQRT